MAISWKNCKRTNTSFDGTWNRSVSYQEFILVCCEWTCCLYHFIIALTFSQTSMARLATSPFSTQRTAKTLKNRKPKNKYGHENIYLTESIMCISIFKPKYIVCMFLLKLSQICNFSKVFGNFYVTENSYIYNLQNVPMWWFILQSNDSTFSVAYIIANEGITNSIHF